jgi:hypothetical protein
LRRDIKLLLRRQRDKYRRQLEKAEAVLVSARNRKQYLQRCICALTKEIGDAESGQLTFDFYQQNTRGQSDDRKTEH